MKDKTLCLYFAPYDRVLNVKKVTAGIEVEIKSGVRDVTYVVLSRNQINELKKWLMENEI